MTQKKNPPWTWVPSLYFAEGLPYVVVMTVSVIMYKRLGLSNTDIAFYTSWLYLPWVIKPFWSPFVDLFKTKRWWIISMQLLIGAGLAGVAFTLPTPYYIQATLAFFWLMAFSSATHDIAADGFYMLALNTSQQSFFVGIRSTFYRLAMISGQGLLIIMAGALESFTGTEPLRFYVETSETSSINTNSSVSTNPLFISGNDSGTKGMTFYVSPSTLTLSAEKISYDSFYRIVDFATTENRKNGFIPSEEKKETKTNAFDAWWTRYISSPLRKFVSGHFGQREKKENQPAELTGNTGLVSVHLSQPPKETESIVLNTSFLKGDKSISMVHGERLVFNGKNWNQPAYIVIQLDPKLNYQTTAEFKGTSGNLPFAWSITFFVLAGIFLLLFIYHRFILPYPASDQKHILTSYPQFKQEFKETFTSFFRKNGIGLALAFMLLYRLAEAMLVKIASPFLLDPHEAGGLGLTTGQVGITYGTIGLLALTLGGITGGIAASRQGLKYWIWPMALAITLPNAAYLFMAWFLPENILLIYLAVAIEQFGYGFGFTAYTLYLIYFSEGKHKTAHYAICTGFMALGMMLPGMIAGWLQELLGYTRFFVCIMIATIPTLLLIPFLKINKEFGKK
ncbi:MAG: MFS transporter [Candidatus Azobacteroides sp.]|nr:MFS transporter [Candidatus Azobacteroides sp.]